MAHKLIEVDAFHDGKEWHYGDILKCEQDCGYAVRKPTEPTATDRGLPKRISHEREIEQAIADGLTGKELVLVIRRHHRAHPWSSVDLDWPQITGLRLAQDNGGAA